MYTIFRRIKSTGDMLTVCNASTIEEAEDAVRSMQLKELNMRGYTMRYVVADENGEAVTAYYKLRLGQRDRNLERQLGKEVE